jgi:hypothetical protein
MLRVATVTLLCSFLLACGSARLVHRTQTGGTIALQGDRNKAMENAHQMMQQHCQGPYQIVEEGEVVVGTDTQHGEESYVAEDGTLVQQGGSSTRQAKEWRVTYTCAAAAAPPPAAPPHAPPGGHDDGYGHEDGYGHDGHDDGYGGGYGDDHDR